MILKTLATVVNHTATVYPTIEAVYDLDTNTEMKNAIDICARPQPKRVVSNTKKFVSVNICRSNAVIPNSKNIIAVNM